MLTAVLGMLSACNLLYDVTQPHQEHECYRLPKSQQQECLDRTMSYEEYNKARDESSDE